MTSKKKRSSSSMERVAEEAWYTVIVDEDDAGAFLEEHSIFAQSKLPSYRQSELELVEDNQ